MNIKPMFETNTIKFVSSAKKVNIETKVLKDPDSILPNGIYKVISWEVRRQLFALCLSLITIFFMTVIIALYATIFNMSWLAYAIPVPLLIAAIWKLFVSMNERSYTLKAIQSYKENLKVGIASTPPFIAKMYINFYKKQVSHNWFTFVTLFYGGIITLLLYWLKDFSWWIFDFSSIIRSLFSNPVLMTWIFTCVLITVVVAHMVFAINRKKRILEIDAYFGEQMTPQSEIETIKATYNKFYRRLFIISVMIILIIPLVVKMILSQIRKKI